MHFNNTAVIIRKSFPCVYVCVCLSPSLCVCVCVVGEEEEGGECGTSVKNLSSHFHVAWRSPSGRQRVSPDHDGGA